MTRQAAVGCRTTSGGHTQAVRQAITLGGPTRCAYSAGSLAELALTWSALCSGRARAVHATASADRLSLRLAPCSRPALSATRQAVLQQVLCGQACKVVADEARIGRTSLARNVGTALGAFGFDKRLAGVPFVLSAAAHAHRHMTERAISIGDEPLPWSMEIPFPQPHPSSRTTTAERSIIQLLVTGLSAEAISRQRGATRRTVANQCSAIFGKLRVSGRLDLFAYLWRCVVPASDPLRQVQPLASTLISRGNLSRYVESARNTSDR